MALGMVTDETSKLFLTLETPFMVARELELKREIVSLLEHLSEEESTIIRGVFNVGKTYQELAEDLETNEVNVATVFHQTLRKLRKIA
jgi:RNA polymerase sigma factor (sigma-70 family)